MGGSRYAKNLRESIRQAANDPGRKPVLISGETGLEKGNIARLGIPALPIEACFG